jgi:hypothetical protein
MLTVAAQLDLVTRLLAVIAAVLPVRALGLDGALTGRVSAFGRSSHVEPPFGLYASSCRGTSRAGLVDEVPASGNAIDEVPPWQLPFVRYGGPAKPIRFAVLLPDDPDGYGDRGLGEGDSKGRL